MVATDEKSKAFSNVTGGAVRRSQEVRISNLSLDVEIPSKESCGGRSNYALGGALTFLIIGAALVTMCSAADALFSSEPSGKLASFFAILAFCNDAMFTSIIPDSLPMSEMMGRGALFSGFAISMLKF